MKHICAIIFVEYVVMFVTIRTSPWIYRKAGVLRIDDKTLSRFACGSSAANSRSVPEDCWERFIGMVENIRHSIHCKMFLYGNIILYLTREVYTSNPKYTTRSNYDSANYLIN